jgi:hypothetical protein
MWGIRGIVPCIFNLGTSFTLQMVCLGGTHYRGGWVGPRAGLDAVENKKVSALAGSSTPIFLSSQITQQYHCTPILYSDETRPVLQFQYKSNIVVAISFFFIGERRDSSVGIATRLLYGRPRNCGSIPSWVFSSPQCLYRLWGPSNIPFNTYWRFFPRG